MAGVTNAYHVLFVDSRFSPISIPTIQTLNLRVTNPANAQGDQLVIRDPLNVTSNLLINATRLTIATNGEGAYSQSGALNLLSPDILWSPAFPRLEYLTNEGSILTFNATYYDNSHGSPYYDPTTGSPYQTFVNHGAITNQGSYIWANYFENSGLIVENGAGSLGINADTAIVTNGYLSALGGNISLAANNLTVSNNYMEAIALSLSPTNFITDGYPLTNQFGHTPTTNTITTLTLTNGNDFHLTGGFSVLSKPAAGDLLGTTVTSVAPEDTLVVNAAGASDMGGTPDGFHNNAAVGRLVLDGGVNSVFRFDSTGSGHAIYLDSLELLDSATNRDVLGNLSEVQVSSGTHVYYAEATANGVSIAEKLNGANGGGFTWVSNYAGVYSSTNLTYPNGITYTFNRPLVQSRNIDSDGDGIVNFNDPTPIPTNWVFDVVTTDPGSGGSGGSTNNPPGGADGQLGSSLPLPAHGASGSGNFEFGKGVFSGLFYDTDGVSPASSGFVTIKTSRNWKFSGKLMLGASKYSFSGFFAPDGTYKNNSVSGRGRPNAFGDPESRPEQR